jgi:hypothetical protein
MHLQVWTCPPPPHTHTFNFSVEEIQPEELMTDEQLQAQLHEENINYEEPVAADSNVMQVGMMTLPNNLDVDSWLSAMLPFQGPVK